MNKRVPVVERLMRRRRITESGCWEWAGQLNQDGYGLMRGPVRTRHLLVHRVAWETLRDPIPDGLCIDHLCRNRSCFNPDHLEPVTPLENARRARHASPTCVHGHLYDADNTRFNTDGYRYCRECQRLRSARRWLAKRNAS